MIIGTYPELQLETLEKIARMSRGLPGTSANLKRCGSGNVPLSLNSPGFVYSPSLLSSLSMQFILQQ